MRERSRSPGIPPTVGVAVAGVAALAVVAAIVVGTVMDGGEEERSTTQPVAADSVTVPSSSTTVGAKTTLAPESATSTTAVATTATAATSTATTPAVSTSSEASTTAAVEPIWLVFDDFEDYPAGTYPSSGGWNPLVPGDAPNATTVSSMAARSGGFSLMLEDPLSGVERADGLEIPAATGSVIVYELDLMILAPGPMGSGGAHVGFFIGGVHQVRMVNAFHFFPGGWVAVEGTSSQAGGEETMVLLTLLEPWRFGQWYHCRARIDLEAGTVDFWLDGVLVASGLRAAPRDHCGTFAVATFLGGQAFFDDIRLVLE